MEGAKPSAEGAADTSNQNHGISILLRFKPLHPPKGGG